MKRIVLSCVLFFASLQCFGQETLEQRVADWKCRSRRFKHRIGLDTQTQQRPLPFRQLWSTISMSNMAILVVKEEF